MRQQFIFQGLYCRSNDQWSTVLQIYLRPNSIVSCAVHLVGRELGIWQEICHLTWNDQLSFRVDGARATRNDKVISNLPETSTLLSSKTALVQQQQSPSWHVYMAEDKVRSSWGTCLFTEPFQWWHSSLPDVRHSILAWADASFEIFATLVPSVNKKIKWPHWPYTVLVGRSEGKRKKKGHLPGSKKSP